MLVRLALVAAGLVPSPQDPEPIPPPDPPGQFCYTTGVNVDGRYVGDCLNECEALCISELVQIEGVTYFKCSCVGADGNPDNACCDLLIEPGGGSYTTFGDCGVEAGCDPEDLGDCVIAWENPAEPSTFFAICN